MCYLWCYTDSGKFACKTGIVRAFTREQSVGFSKVSRTSVCYLHVLMNLTDLEAKKCCESSAPQYSLLPIADKSWIFAISHPLKILTSWVYLVRLSAILSLNFWHWEARKELKKKFNKTNIQVEKCLWIQ